MASKYSTNFLGTSFHTDPELVSGQKPMRTPFSNTCLGVMAVAMLLQWHCLQQRHVMFSVCTSVAKLIKQDITKYIILHPYISFLHYVITLHSFRVAFILWIWSWLVGMFSKSKVHCFGSKKNLVGFWGCMENWDKCAYHNPTEGTDLIRICMWCTNQKLHYKRAIRCFLWKHSKLKGPSWSKLLWTSCQKKNNSHS